MESPRRLEILSERPRATSPFNPCNSEEESVILFLLTPFIGDDEEADVADFLLDGDGGIVLSSLDFLGVVPELVDLLELDSELLVVDFLVEVLLLLLLVVEEDF